MHVRTKPPGDAPPAPEDVLAQVERILASADFDASPRSRSFLRFVVEETLVGRQGGLTQETIASRVFLRRDDFDPTIDPIVRIQAGRLRRSLERYYLLEGAGDSVRIELPRGTYVPGLQWAPALVSETRAEPAEGRAAPVDDWPTVVACVVEAATPDPELDRAAVRFLDQLAVELGRYRDVRVVIQRGPTPPATPAGGGEMFALSARFDESGLRVIARLVDRRDRSQVWAEEYRAGSATRETFEEETARVVAAAVASEQGAVARQLWTEQRARPRGANTPYGAILASYRFFFTRNAADLAPAIGALRQAVAAEPECSLAWVELSRLYNANHAFEVSPVETPIEHAVDYAQNGVRLDPSSQRARCALAGALLMKGELVAARREVEAAFDLNPDSLVYLEWIGWIMTMLGEWERGPELVRRALSRNPNVIPIAHHALWLAHLQRGQIEEAYQAALQHRDRTFFVRAMMRACCLGHLGRRGEARVELADLLASKPDFPRRGRTLIGRHIKFPDLQERVVQGLDKAGLTLY